MTLGAIVLGFCIDFLIGDPHGIPHPIVAIGNLIGFLEKKLRAWAGEDRAWLLMNGFLMTVLVCLLTFMVPYWLLYLAEGVSKWLRFALETLMFYQIFAMRSLKDESMRVYYALLENDIAKARKFLSWIVGRDTEELDEAEITKAAVETVAENTSDGIVAPMFYMFIGGAPLAFMYKGINTMDSMVGYKNEKYLYFGRYAAKLDDIVNFLPARLCALIMLAAAMVLNLDYKNALRIFVRDRYNHLSPNSAQTESVIAGALGVQLGGGHNYFGQYVYKKTIGDDIRPVCAKDIETTNKVLYLTSVIGVICFLVIKAGVLYWRW